MMRPYSAPLRTGSPLSGGAVALVRGSLVGEASCCAKRRDARTDLLGDVRPSVRLPYLDTLAEFLQHAIALLARAHVGRAIQPRLTLQARRDLAAAQAACLGVFRWRLHVRTIGGRLRARSRGTNSAIPRPCARGDARGIRRAAARFERPSPPGEFRPHEIGRTGSSRVDGARSSACSRPGASSVWRPLRLLLVVLPSLLDHHLVQLHAGNPERFAHVRNLRGRCPASSLLADHRRTVQLRECDNERVSA
jgi:hypothetical protein